MHSTSSTSTEKTILSISELNRQARLTIEQRFNQVWVIGEMSNFARPRSGHWYFSLKDDQAQVRCAMFANRNRGVSMQPGDGQLVIARGRVSLYEGRGDFQIIVDHLEAAGEGALRQAFDQLKVKLASEGLFAPERKQVLPDIPKHCVVISSPTGAAVKDVIAVWRRRFRSMRVTLLPAAVQGAEAEQQLIQAIELAPSLQPDVVLLTRGGGSLEDLWSFNLESVARALAACPCPTVSAVGHEIDVTICDFVADMRAPTPSAAAELIVPDGDELHRTFAHQLRQLQHIWQRQIEFRVLSLDNLKLKLQSPERVLERANQRVDDAAGRMSSAIRQALRILHIRVVAQSRQLQTSGPTNQLENAKTRLSSLQSRLTFSLEQQTRRQQQKLSNLSRMLHSVSPLPTIGRGYGVVTNPAGDVISSVEHLEPGHETVTYLQDGAFVGQVKQVQPDVTLNTVVLNAKQNDKS